MKRVIWTMIVVSLLLGCTMGNEDVKSEALAVACDEWGLVLEEEYQNLYTVEWKVFSMDGDYAYIYYNVDLKVPGTARLTYAGDTWVVFEWIVDEWVLLSSELL